MVEMEQTGGGSLCAVNHPHGNASVRWRETAWGSKVWIEIITDVQKYCPTDARGRSLRIGVSAGRRPQPLDDEAVRVRL